MVLFRGENREDKMTDRAGATEVSVEVRPAGSDGAQASPRPVAIADAARWMPSWPTAEEGECAGEMFNCHRELDNPVPRWRVCLGNGRETSASCQEKPWGRRVDSRGLAQR